MAERRWRVAPRGDPMTFRPCCPFRFVRQSGQQERVEIDL